MKKKHPSPVKFDDSQTMVDATGNVILSGFFPEPGRVTVSGRGGEHLPKIRIDAGFIYPGVTIRHPRKGPGSGRNLHVVFAAPIVDCASRRNFGPGYRATIFRDADGTWFLSYGCETYAVSYWRKNWRAIGAPHGERGAAARFPVNIATTFIRAYCGPSNP